MGRRHASAGTMALMPRQAEGPPAPPAPEPGPARDTLTGLPLRAGLPSLAALGGVAAVVHVDLDRFAEVNSGHGYAVGDEVLVQFADRLRLLAGPDDVVLRLGADEFAVLLRGAPTAAAVRHLAERVVDRAAAPFVVVVPDGPPVEVRLAASVGLARGDDVPGALADLLAEADRSMRRAKSGGRGTVRGPEPTRPRADPPAGAGSVGAPARSPHAIERRLRRALDRGEVHVHFQPVVQLPEGRVVAHEALARWTDAELGVVGPDEFIPVAERGGMIIDLGRDVLHRACAAAAAWPEGPDGACPAVAVNVSAVQLADHRFADDVLDALARTGLAPERLCLELTETSGLVDDDLAVRSLARLRGHGVRTALDDFGTGRAALSVMRLLPLDVVKIDRGFVAGLARDATDAVMVRSLVDAAHHLGLEVCAEGVEDLEQARALVGLGVDRAQGWLFGRPSTEACPETAAGVGDVGPVGAVVGADVVEEFVVVVDVHRQVRFASSGARSVLGAPIPLGAGGIRLVHPEHRHAFARLVAEATPGAGVEMTLRTSERAVRGSRWLRVRAQAFHRPGTGDREVVLTCRDVHAQVSAQTDAAVLDHVLRAAIDVAPVAIAVSDLDGRVLRANAALASLLGSSIESVVGRTVEQLTHPDDHGQDVDNLRAARAGEDRQVVRKRYLHADGHPVPAVCEVLVVRGPSGVPVALVAHVRPDDV